jgi:twinkle protein
MTLLRSNLPCKWCDSSDAMAEYENGWKCFSCDKLTFKDNEGNKEVTQQKNKLIPSNLIRYMALPLRKISLNTCEFFSYGVSKDKNGKYVHVEQYLDIYGDIKWQRIRTEDKKFSWLGSSVDTCPLFGQWLFTPGENIDVIVTEGSIDAMSVSEAHMARYRKRYPVVSICNGASSAHKELARNIEWLNGFRQVKLGLDSDSAGRDAMEKCIELFEPGKLSIIKWG